ncbi:MAG: DUF4197 domain-containing protein [Treponema sp.]|nr:DUF4197 domain-containing protein [Treponema sp.]
MKVRNSLLILIFLVSFSFFSCDTLFDILGLAGSGDALFTNAEAVEAMKSALNIGADNASNELSKENAYYNDPLLKILLPPEADVILDVIEKIPDGEKLVNNVIKGLNRSAEEAAKEVVPIFSTAIADMTVQDGIGIVTGERDAATVYLKDKTYSQLMELYEPEMEDVLDMPLIPVVNISTNTAWKNLVDAYNDNIASLDDNLIGGIIGGLAGVTLEPVEVDLSQYVTGKALDGVFLTVAEEEGKIRDNPWGYASNIIEKVFGAVKNNFK